METLEKKCEICSKLKTPERRHWRRRRSAVFIVNFEHILHFFSSVSIVDFEQVNVRWVLSVIFLSMLMMLFSTLSVTSL